MTSHITRVLNHCRYPPILVAIIIVVTFITNQMASATTVKGQLPKLVAFDLDGTIWSPDMYQLWGGGAPFRPQDSAGKGHCHVLLDRANQRVRLLGVVPTLFHAFHSDPEALWKDTILAWVSCTDEPEWAKECLEKFKTSGGVSIGAVVHASEIYKANKQHHFKQLKAKYPDIDYKDMLFFDNESHNIHAVSKLGVRCVFCPDGVTQQAWDEGLALFK